jgi:uncharacterized membrane protein YccC
MPNVAALKSAARAAIVMPAVLAFADQVIGQPQTSLFAAFGSIALLVLTEFAGPPRIRFLAYAGLACVGAAFITLGTVCSRNPWLAAGVMAIVGFATLFSGVFGGYFVAGTTGALLTVVLPVTLPSPNSTLPDRLEGWGLASGAVICAVMLLWPPRRSSELAREAAGALRTVADFVTANRDQSTDRGRLAREAVDAFGRRQLRTQHRPTGPTGPTAALASLPDELDWLLTLLVPPAGAQPLELTGDEEAEALAAAATVLRASADRLEGRDTAPDFARLDAARDALASALVRRLPALPADMPSGTLPGTLESPFRIRSATYSARQAAGYALLAAGADAQELESTDVVQPRSARAALEATEQSAVEHASVRSVWFQNSIRGAAGLAIAVYIAQRTGVQHGFWVVLGTLSVLRSNALGTGWSILSALTGTAVGIVIGALLVIGIGTHEAVLWAVLPIALLLAAYAPRAISFAAGQAGFTVVLFVLFNIIQPAGWRVGLVRIEDVAIGFAISLGVGLLFWPRGAGALLRHDLAGAYARGADYVVATARQLIEGEEAVDAARAGRAADAVFHRLDDDFREYLGERSPTVVDVGDVAAMVGGAARVRRVAQSLTSLGRMADGKTLERCGQNLDGELHALQSWYVTLGYALVNGRPVPPPHIRDTEGRTRLLTCVSNAARGRDEENVKAALVLLWASQHLDVLWQLEAHLRERASSAEKTSTETRALQKVKALAR